jgi:hypothetical protein
MVSNESFQNFFFILNNIQKLAQLYHNSFVAIIIVFLELILFLGITLKTDELSMTFERMN